MRHLPYPKIPTATQLGATSVGGTWVATEKIHGGQLVVAYDGVEVRVGKRRAWLDGDEPFFGWQLLRGSLDAAARAALARGGCAVRLYGELYGGSYPHPEVTPVPGAVPVQTGIWYCPDIRFALFDVLTHADPADPGTFRPYAEVAAIAADAGLDVVPLLGRGSRASLDAVPVRFPSRVPAMLGLPPLPGNLAEGLVLRPDAALTPDRRPIVKYKIAEFDERRFAASRPWDPRAPLRPAQLGELAQALVNEPRLAGARSKVGPAAGERLLDEVVLDVLVDLSEAFPAAVAALTDSEQDTLADTIRAAARERS